MVNVVQLSAAAESDCHWPRASSLHTGKQRLIILVRESAYMLTGISDIGPHPLGCGTVEAPHPSGCCVDWRAADESQLQGFLSSRAATVVGAD